MFLRWTPMVVGNYCTDPYSNGTDWFMDIRKRYVCDKCKKEQDILVDTIKQDKKFK